MQYRNSFLKYILIHRFVKKKKKKRKNLLFLCHESMLCARLIQVDFHFAAETMNGKKKKKSAEQDIYSVFLISELISHFISLCLFLNSFF